MTKNGKWEDRLTDKPSEEWMQKMHGIAQDTSRKTGKPIVALGLPTFDECKSDWAVNLAMMVCASGPYFTFAFCHSKATFVAHARNLIVEAAIDVGAEYIMWTDSDMTFPKETLLRLRSWNKDIVCASYPKKKPPYKIVGKLKPRPGDKVGEFKEVLTNGLYEMDEVGFGVMLTKTEIFKKMPKPWFHYEYKKGSNNLTGEDVLWCPRVQKLGYKIWIDAALSMYVGHIGNFIFRPEGAYELFDIETGQRKEDKDIVRQQVETAAANG